MKIDLEELGKQLHAKLDGGIVRLKAAQTHLENVHQETEAVIQSKLKAARETLEAKKQEAVAAKTKLEKFAWSGVRSFILAHFVKDFAHGGIVQPKVFGNFFLPLAMSEMRGAHGAVAKEIADEVRD